MKQASHPRVDVIVPCYNHGRWLAENIESLLAQTYPNVGIILVDDGSTDDTPAVAQRYGERVQYIRKPNAGLSAARNTGIMAARGEFVHFLDSDDFLRTEMLAQQMEAALASPTAGVLHSSWQEVDLASEIQRRKEAPPLGADPFHTLLAANPFPPCCVTVRREAFANVGLFEVLLRSSEDWDMWLRLAAAGYEFVPVPAATAVYRRYPGSMSRNYDGMWRSGLEVFQRSQAYHPGCAICARTIAAAVRELRRGCGDLLVRDIYDRKARAGWRAGVSRAGRALRGDPALLSRLLGECLIAARLRTGCPGAEEVPGLKPRSVLTKPAFAGSEPTPGTREVGSGLVTADRGLNPGSD